jgi:hypothetical protein
VRPRPEPQQTVMIEAIRPPSPLDAWQSCQTVLSDP